MLDLIGRYSLVRPSADRQMSMDAFEAVQTGHPMVALLEIDVTRALSAIDALRARGERVSLFAFLVSAIARTIAEHPDLNLVRHGSRLARFDDVDVSVPVEVRTSEGHYPRQVVLRRAQDASPAQLYAQLEAARTEVARSGALGAEDRWVRRLAAFARIFPRWLRLALVRAILRSAFRIKARAGTTLVTSVGKFATVPGFAFTLIQGPRAATFAIGSVVSKPWAHEGAIALRSIQSLTIVVDHDLVDGAPAARFAQRLVARIEAAEGL